MIRSGMGASPAEGGVQLDPGVSWMLRYQRGDEAAFDLLVEEYSPRVYALLTRFLGPASNREDLVQEVFLRVVRTKHRYEPEARFSSWLYRIVYNLCVNETERARTRGSPSGTLEEEPGSGRETDGREDERAHPPVLALEREDRAAAVRRALAALPVKQRLALVLFKYEELSHQEIARVLDSSEKAIKSLVHRARENLRAALAAYMEEDPS